MTHNRQFGTKTPIASRSRPLDIYLPKPKATLTTTAEISCTNDSDQEPHVRGNAPLHILYALPSKSHVFIIPTRNDIHILPRGCQSDIWQHFLRHSANTHTWAPIFGIRFYQFHVNNETPHHHPFAILIANTPFVKNAATENSIACLQ